MMDDLISRQAAIKAIDDLPNCYNGYSDTYDKACIIGVLEELPAAEKRGRWITGDKMKGYPRIPYRPWSMYCSCCREEAYNGDLLFDYCPFCGARMEE